MAAEGGASMSGDRHGKSAAFGAVCTCGHAADWHSHGGAGDCEHDAECGCGVYRDAITCQPGCACGDPTLCGTAPPEEVHTAQRERGPGQLTDYWTRRDLASSTRVRAVASMSGDPQDWMVVRKSRTIIGGYSVIAYGLTEDVARRRAAAYKTPHQVMREPELLRIRLAALEARRA